MMPLCHAKSLYFSVTFAMLGATLVVDDRPHSDPAALLGLLARERITFTSLVPTHYIMMLALDDELKARHDLSRVGKLLISSAPARPDQACDPGVVPQRPAVRALRLHHRSRLGDRAAPGRAAHAHRLGGPGEAGSSPQGGAESSGRPGAFRGAWYSVGDLARRDEQGFIHLVDRKSNMIISGGKNIYPSEVEAVLAAHPAVLDVAVIGVADVKWGESVMAVVVPRYGAELRQADLEAWCRERIAGFERPRAYAFVTEAQMPRTATGKIQHRVLRDQMMASTANQAQ